MAHVGEEVGLGPRRCLGRFFGCSQFALGLLPGRRHVIDGLNQFVPLAAFFESSAEIASGDRATHFRYSPIRPDQAVEAAGQLADLIFIFLVESER